jgi:hypothetical protein
MMFDNDKLMLCKILLPLGTGTDDAIGRIKDTGMDLEVEDSVGGFLGISITNRANQETGLTAIQLVRAWTKIQMD